LEFPINCIAAIDINSGGIVIIIILKITQIGDSSSVTPEEQNYWILESVKRININPGATQRVSRYAYQ
jgi:hypothetical protein